MENQINIEQLNNKNIIKSLWYLSKMILINIFL